MKIGQLARTVDCKVETLRYYEKEGLLPAPDRTEGNYRCYGAEHVGRLRFIRNCRALDMTLDEIRSLLSTMDYPRKECTSVNHLLDGHIEHVNVRIRELQGLKRQLAELRDRCQTEQSIQDCGILQGLADLEIEGKGARATHLG